MSRCQRFYKVENQFNSFNQQGANKLVPFLVPEPVCEDVPREVCSFGVKSTSQGTRPLITKWCLKPGNHIELAYLEICLMSDLVGIIYSS